MLGSEIKHLGRHSIVYSAGNLGARLISFLFLPLYTRYLSPADYGMLEIVTLTSALATLVLGCGMSTAVTRFYPVFAGDDQKRVVSTAAIFLPVFSALAGLGLMLAAPPLGRLIFGNSAYVGLLVLALANVFLESSGIVPWVYLRILDRSGLFVTLSLTQLLLGASLNVVLLVWAGLGTRGVLYSLLITNAVVNLSLLGYTLRRVGVRFSWSQLTTMLRFGGPFVPSNLVMWVLNMGDRFLLNRLSTPQQVGLYSLGYKLGGLVSDGFSSPFYSAWMPRMFVIAEREAAEILYARIFTYFLLVEVVLTLALSLFAHEIVAVMAASSFMPAATVVPLVALGYLFYSSFNFCATGLFVRDRTSWLPIIYGAAAGVNIVGNLLLIPWFGMLAAAINTAVAFALLPPLAILLGRQRYPIPFEYGRIAKLVGAAAGAYAIAMALPDLGVVATIVLKAAVLGAYPVLLMALGFFGADEWALARTTALRLRTAWLPSLSTR
jgi:O-antigen/teichoic acid export membrane protein